MYEACFGVSLKHASFWGEIFRKLKLKPLQMEMIVGERGADVGGQRPCTKHVSGLVSNMFICCGVKYLLRKLKLKGPGMENACVNK